MSTKEHRSQDKWSLLEGEAGILMKAGKVLHLGNSFKGDLPCNDSICSVRFSVCVLVYNKKKFNNKQLSFPSHIHLLGMAAILRLWLRSQTLVTIDVVLIFYSVTSCVTFGKLLCLSEPDVLHLEDGKLYHRAHRFAPRIK